VLLIKLGLFAIIVIFGAFHTLAVVPRIRPKLLATDKTVSTVSFAYTVSIELLLGLAVLLVVASLRAH
jgi:putative copper export protein